MAENARGARGPVSLSDLVSRAVAHEDLPAEFHSYLRWDSWLGLGLVGIYLILLWALHAKIQDPWVTPEFFMLGWGAFRSASFLGGSVGVPVVLGLGTWFAGGWLAIQTGGFAYGTRWQQLGSLGLVVAGGLALIPLLIMAVTFGINLAIYALIAAGCVALFVGFVRSLYE